MAKSKEEISQVRGTKVCIKTSTNPLAGHWVSKHTLTKIEPTS